MFSLLQVRGLASIAAVALALGSAAAATGGWVAITNETDRVMVVQPTTTPDRGPKRCKPIRLLPGETCREHYPEGRLRVELFDGQVPDRLLFSSHILLKADKQAFAIRAERHTIVLVPIKSK